MAFQKGGHMKKFMMRLMGIMLALALVLPTFPVPAAAAEVPALDSAVSVENALAILHAYDPDGTFITDFTQKHTSNISFWLFGAESNAEGLDTVVHEEYHMYSFDKPPFGKQAIYIGDGQDIYTPFVAPRGINLVPTSTWTSTLPDELKTFRYNEYASPESETSANRNGPYGLLNEFTAYSWGMHNQLALFPYYAAQEDAVSAWMSFMNACGNDRQAYAEFRFWLLGYLRYAKKNDQALYNLFVNDQDFARAYIVTRDRFEAQIAEYEAKLDEIISLLQEKGIRAYISNGYFYFGTYGTGMHEEEYQILMEQLQDPELLKIEQVLRDKAEGNEPTGFRYQKGSYNWYQDGEFQSSMTGLVKGTINGKTNWYFIKNGVFTKATGLARRADGSSATWFYVSKGAYKKGTGIAKRADGSSSKRYYVLKGKFKKYTGTITFNGREYEVVNGIIQ